MATAILLAAQGRQRHGRPSACRCARRSPNTLPTCRQGSPAKPARRDVGTLCRACRAADQARFGRLDQAHDLGHDLFEIAVAANQLRLWKTVFEIVIKPSGSSPRRMAEMPLWLAATKIDPSEHSPTAKRISVFVPPAEIGRRHAEDFRQVGVEAAAGVKSSIVDSFSHGVAPFEIFANPLLAVAVA